MTENQSAMGWEKDAGSPHSACPTGKPQGMEGHFARIKLNGESQDQAKGVHKKREAQE